MSDLTPLLSRRCAVARPDAGNVPEQRHETVLYHDTRKRRAGNGRLQQIVSSSPVYKPISVYFLISDSLHGYVRIVNPFSASASEILQDVSGMTPRDDCYTSTYGLSGVMKTTVNRVPPTWNMLWFLTGDMSDFTPIAL